MKKMKIISVLAILLIFTGCKEYVDFEVSRLVFGWKVSLVFGIIALIFFSLSTMVRKEIGVADFPTY